MEKMTEVKELYTWLLTTTKKLNINIYYSIDFAHNCNFYAHNIFQNEITTNFCFFISDNLQKYQDILNICSIFSVLCSLNNKNFKIFLKKMCVFLGKVKNYDSNDINLINKILFYLQDDSLNNKIFENFEHNLIYNIIREAYLLSSIDIYYHINKSNLLINKNCTNDINNIIKYFENYYLKLYDNSHIFNNYSIEKFYELCTIESKKINHLKNTLCT